MSWKSTGILLVMAAVLFAFVWLIERPLRQERLRQASRIILEGFDPASVNSIEIKPHSADAIRAERADKARAPWRLTQPISYPAQGEPIAALLDVLARLGWEDRISPGEMKTQPDAQGKYGFTEPQFEISLQGSAAPRQVLIGQSSALGDQVFLEVVGNPEVYLVNAAWLRLVPVNNNQWRDPSLLNLAALSYDSIQAQSPGRSFELDRDPTNHLWLMKKPVAARADTALVNRCLGELQTLRVRQFVSDDPKADLELYGLQTSPQTPELDLSFYHGTNLAAELEVGASLTNEPDLAFARRHQPGNVVLIDRQAAQAWEDAYTKFLDYHFISVSPASVGAISVEGDGQFTVQKQTNGQWRVQDGTNFPADAGLMRDWLASFTNIETQIEKTVATDLSEYGLTKPLRQYTLRSSAADGPSNGIIARIEFGVNNSGKIFERRPDETFLNLVNRDDFNRLPRAAWQLRDRRIWSFDSSNVASLTIHQLGATRKFLRDPDGNWTFAPSYHAPPGVNWPALEEGVHRLGQLRAVYWSGVGRAGGEDFGFTQADFSLSLEVRQGDVMKTNSIQFGGRSPYSYPYAAVIKDGQRLIFEFPVDLYENFVRENMTIPAALRYHP